MVRATLPRPQPLDSISWKATELLTPPEESGEQDGVAFLGLEEMKVLAITVGRAGQCHQGLT